MVVRARPAETANELLQEALIRHQIYVSRYATGSVSIATDMLNASEGRLRSLLDERLGMLAGRPYSKALEKRLQLLLARVRELRGRVMDNISDRWQRELQAFSAAEGRYIANAASTVSPVDLGLREPSEATYRGLVSATPFEGRLFRDHLKGWRRGDIQRMEAAIRAGVVGGETTGQITARVLGVASARGRTGVTQVTRNQAEALGRTAVNAIGDAARAELYQANKDVFNVELYLATLDRRTTPICRALDGNKYPVGEGPRPPQHWQCRSLRVPVIGDELAGRRPMKPVTEEQLVREYNRREGLSASSREALPRGHRGRFDDFARRRTREMIGTVPARTTYQQFMANQPRWFQDDVLGQRRARLFREGGLTLDRFVDDRTGRQFTLTELYAREREAFRRAGLRP